ncbi:chemotaxis protein CheC [Sporolactobacillus shoreae]|uniref:Chemotaxis protein CheC n=1 Tax=Sporolactobacillus shoreae TaxID=1465501 RepID=A0A4Z0GSF2_9BACL|nr:chemotaxis protein CheC [Sporolactobacillus shoreae]TGB00303.1 chemotaxis protein CheC [Sporolactobacillus shoreae]
MHRLSDLQSIHLDLLKEAGNIGAGHAATALSTLLQKRIEMNIPSLKVVPLPEVLDRDAEKHVATSYIEVSGGFRGCFFMMFEVNLANKLIRQLVPDGSVFDNDMGKSAFCEISNILCGSYLSAISSFFHTQLNQSPPNYAVDMEGAILGEGLVELSLYDDSILLIEAELFDQDEKNRFTGEFLFIPLPESLDLLFSMAEGKSSM